MNDCGASFCVGIILTRLFRFFHKNFEKLEKSGAFFTNAPQNVSNKERLRRLTRHKAHGKRDGVDVLTVDKTKKIFHRKGRHLLQRLNDGGERRADEPKHGIHVVADDAEPLRHVEPQMADSLQNARGQIIVDTEHAVAVAAEKTGDHRGGTVLDSKAARTNRKCLFFQICGAHRGQKSLQTPRVVGGKIRRNEHGGAAAAAARQKFARKIPAHAVVTDKIRPGGVVVGLSIKIKHGNVRGVFFGDDRAGEVDDPADLIGAHHVHARVGEL